MVWTILTLDRIKQGYGEGYGKVWLLVCAGAGDRPA